MIPRFPSPEHPPRRALSLCLLALGAAAVYAASDRLQGLPGALPAVWITWGAVAGGALLTAVEDARAREREGR